LHATNKDHTISENALAGRLQHERVLASVQAFFHGDAHLYRNFASIDSVLCSLDEVIRCFRIAAHDAHALRQTAQVARGESKLAHCGVRSLPGMALETINGNAVEFGQPLRRCGVYPPGKQNLAARFRNEFDVRREIGHDAALQHLTLHHFGGCGNAYGDRFALADLVLEDAQGLVERVDQEVGRAVADGLLPGAWIGSRRQRCGTGDVARNQRCAAVRAEVPSIQQLSAQSRFRSWARLHSCGGRVANQGCVEAFNMENEVERGRRAGIRRQGRTLSVAGKWLSE